MKTIVYVAVLLGLISHALSTNTPQRVLGGGNTIKGGNQGPSFGPNGIFVVSSVYYRTIFQVNPSTGAVSTFVPSPYGEGDDNAWGPDGTLVWTSLLSGVVRARKPDGTITKIADIAWPNGVAFNGTRCYVSTFPAPPYAIWEVDPQGVNPPVKVMDLPVPLNGFNFGPDGNIYGPFPFLGQVVRINLRTQQIDVVASDFGDPESVRVDSQGRVYVIDTAASKLIKLDISHGLPATKTVIATIPEPSYLDNFAIGPNGNFYLSNSVENEIVKVTPSGTVSTVTNAALGLPGDISFDPLNPSKLYIADTFSIRKVGTATGSNSVILRADQQSLGFGVYTIHVSATHILEGEPFSGLVNVRSKTTLDVVATLSPINFPYGIVELWDGTAVVADYFAGLTLFHNDYQNSTVLDTGYSSLVGLARGLDPSTIYFTDYTTGTVGAYNLLTRRTRVFVTGLNAPEGIDVNALGTKIIVAEVGAKRIISINPFTHGITVVARNLNIGLGVTENMPQPNIVTGVALSADGEKVYFTSDLDNALYSVDI